jgi:alanine dehydrogenase
MIPFFDEAQVRDRLRMEELIPAMERALADFSAGRAAQPVRQVVPVAEHGGFLGSMPAGWATAWAPSW